MKVFDIPFTTAIKSYSLRALITAALVSVGSVSWAGDHGHKDRHRDNNQHREQRRDNHREDRARQHEREGHRDNRRHAEQRDKHRHHAKHRHHEQNRRHDVHKRHDHHFYSPPRHHDKHRKHHHKHHAKRYHHSRHHNHHAKRHVRHHGSHEAAFLLGGVILGAVLSDVSNGHNDYYYDGRDTRSYRNLRAQTCYRSYYENGRRVLVETSRDYCVAY